MCIIYPYISHVNPILLKLQTGGSQAVPSLRFDPAAWIRLERSGRLGTARQTPRVGGRREIVSWAPNESIWEKPTELFGMVLYQVWALAQLIFEQLYKPLCSCEVVGLSDMLRVIKQNLTADGSEIGFLERSFDTAGEQVLGVCFGMDSASTRNCQFFSGGLEERKTGCRCFRSPRGDSKILQDHPGSIPRIEGFIQDRPDPPLRFYSRTSNTLRHRIGGPFALRIQFRLGRTAFGLVCEVHNWVLLPWI